MCANIQAKQTALTFLSQTSPKLDLGLEIQETNVASASSKYSVCQFSGKTDNFDPNLPKNKFGVRILKNYVQMQNQLLQDTMCDNFQAKRTTLNFSA